MLIPNQCANIALLAACTKKISNANTGLAFGVNGPVAAIVNVFANSNPVVACKPTIVAPSPTKFTVNPVVNAFTTSALGGTNSRSAIDVFNRSPNRTNPSDQNVVKKPAMIPNKIKYNPASVAFVNPLNKSENTTTTAATVNRINCPQNPQRPNVLHAAAVRETLRAIDSALSTDAFVVTPRLSLVFFAARLVDILIDAEEDAVDDSENTKACLFNSNAFDDDEEILPFEGVKALCQTLLRRVRRATKGFRNVGKETDVVSNMMMMMMMRVASRKRAQAFLWRHFKRPHSSKYLSLGYHKKEEKGDYKNTNDECHHKTPTPTPCCEYRWKSNFSFFLDTRTRKHTHIYMGPTKRRTTRRDARG